MCTCTCTAVRWLQSASITLLPDNKAVFVSCSVTESSPPVECLVVKNCSTCKEDTPNTLVPFTNHTTLMVSPEASYYISVQVIRIDVFKQLEDYTIVEFVTVPKPVNQPNTGTSCKSYDCKSLIVISQQNSFSIILLERCWFSIQHRTKSL